MQQLSFENPVFAAFAISAAIMGLKAVAMSWLTVIQMMRFSSGFRSPEDLKWTPFNPSPDPKQLQPDERVERIRRIQLNDLENLPFFFMAGALYVLTDRRWSKPNGCIMATPFRVCCISQRTSQRKSTKCAPPFGPPAFSSSFTWRSSRCCTLSDRLFRK